MRFLSVVDNRLRPVEDPGAVRLRFGLFATLFSLILAAGLQGLTDGLDRALSLPAGVLSLVLIAAAALFLFTRNMPVARPHVKHRGEPADCEVLVVFLSVRNVADLSATYLAPTEAPVSLTQTDIAARFGKDNWLMPILSIRHQLDQSRPGAPTRLDTLLVIPSKESDAQFGDFKTFVDAWTPDQPLRVVAIPKGGVDYVEIDAVFHALDLCRDWTVRENKPRMLIDLTSGRAQCSAAAAIWSLSPGQVFKYVYTGTAPRHAAFQVGFENTGDLPGGH
jgi:hypothetical protein